MIVMACSFKRYGIRARPGKSAGKVYVTPRMAGTMRYNRGSMSSWLLGNRHLCSQSNVSRGALMQASPRIVKKHYRITNAAATLRIRFVSQDNSSLKYEKEIQPCTDL